MDLSKRNNSESRFSEASPSSSPIPASPSSLSPASPSSLTPASPGLDNRSLHNERIPSPNMTLTNFSIAEILKPDFGVKQSKTNIFQRIYSRPSVISSNFTSRNNHRRVPRSPVSSKTETSKKEQLPSPNSNSEENKNLWPAWVYCTRYSDRPTSGPRARHVRRKRNSSESSEDKRPRVAFTNEQLEKLKVEFEECRYLTEARRRDLAIRLHLSESQIKIWFQNKRAKLKKSSTSENPLALCLRNQGLYNHAPIGD